MISGRLLPVFLVALTAVIGWACAPDSPVERSAPTPPGPIAAESVPDRAAVQPGALPAETAEASVSNPLAGTAWRLVKIMSMDDTDYVPDDPSLYTLEFGADGAMSVRADCNRGTGSWTSESAGQLTFGLIAATQAVCPPESLHDRYMSQFPWVRSYVMEEGHLFLATMADGSIIEFEPTGVAPVVATVLGEDIRAFDAEEMQAAILDRLFARYAVERGIRAEPSEVQAWVEGLERARTGDRQEKKARLADLQGQLESENLSAADRKSLEAEAAQLSELLAALGEGANLSAVESAQIETMQDEMARSIIEQWKLNRELYRDYGGRIIFQQAGPEPLDAYREFLEQRQREGAFKIHDPELEPGFWRYFTDDSIHSFMEPGSPEEERAFEVPPWEWFATGS